MSEWQPRETAPKDGTQFLVWDGAGGFDLASWLDGRNSGFYNDDLRTVVFTHWHALSQPSGT